MKLGHAIQRSTTTTRVRAKLHEAETSPEACLKTETEETKATEDLGGGLSSKNNKRRLRREDGPADRRVSTEDKGL